MHRTNDHWRTLVFLLAAVGACLGQERKSDRSPEIAAVRRAAEDYVAALREGDTKTLAAMWTDDGDFVESSGELTKGKVLVQRVGKTSTKEGNARHITVDSVRLLTSDVAIEDGTAELPGDEDNFLVTRYSAFWIKLDGKWLLDGVRVSAAQAPLPRHRLRTLHWMIGDWVQKGGDGHIEMSCRLSPEGNYLLREIKAEGPSGKTQFASQRIGWNPASMRITVWTFDSDGGHAIGTATQDGDEWVVKSTGVLSGGEIISSTSTIARQGDGFVWELPQHGAEGASPKRRKIEFVRQSVEKSPQSLR